ncbi:MAG: PBP1A family penicillin-binding protein [Myxococcales bacterium]|nr:PBP1A family penicillin-binding protein [Myxococcales bacterium]
MGAFVWRWTRRALVGLAALAVAGVVAIFLVVRHYERDLPSVIDLRSSYRPPQTTRVLARDGTLLAELFTERRTVIAFKDVPVHMRLAVLAAEDAGFYQHKGVNWLGIARAVIVNLRSGRVRQGGSTITQQVCKNVLLDAEHSYRRKVREAILAGRLEEQLTKDEILELYLNHIYFGNGRFGIEEAARGTFGKPARDLTIGEAALLAGTIAGPELFSPRRDLKRALGRKKFVLDQMRDKHFIDEAQHERAMAEPVRLTPLVEPQSELAPEVVAIARRTLLELEPERAQRGGFTVTTTLDPKLQAAARKAVRENLLAYDKRHGLTGGLKPPAAPVIDKKTKKPVVNRKEPAAYTGTPSFESHRVYTGVVSGTDDAAGLVEVQVGTVSGFFKLGEYERYNPQHASPSAFAPVGAKVRVSLLAPAPAPSADDEKAAAKSRVPLRLELGPEASMVALDVRSRDVLALVGSYEGQAGALDRATQSRRQPGSTFKPLVYSYALHSRRFTAASLIDVNPQAFGGFGPYKPTNYEGWTGKDPLRLREALAGSVNIVAVRVLESVGPANVVDWAKAFGIRSTMKPDLSLALGSYELEAIELVGAYTTLAAGGVYEEPRVVTKIVGPDGKELELRPRPPARRVLEPDVAYLTTHLMTSVIDHGTAQRAKVLGRPLAGKTGTTNDSKDTWFAGFSTDIAAVTWVGYDDGKPLGGAEAGGTTALPAWIAFMKAAHEGRPKSEFPRPGGLVDVKIDKHTGKLANPGDEDAMTELFLAGTEPTEVAEAADGGADASAPTPAPSALASAPLGAPEVPAFPGLPSAPPALPALPALPGLPAPAKVE